MYYQIMIAIYIPWVKKHKLSRQVAHNILLNFRVDRIYRN